MFIMNQATAQAQRRSAGEGIRDSGCGVRDLGFGIRAALLGYGASTKRERGHLARYGTGVLPVSGHGHDAMARKAGGTPALQVVAPGFSPAHAVLKDGATKGAC
ncbi:MAG: hypothetical protein ABSF71_19940 [Terriglobia bacterium]